MANPLKELVTRNPLRDLLVQSELEAGWTDAERTRRQVQAALRPHFEGEPTYRWEPSMWEGEPVLTEQFIPSLPESFERDMAAPVSLQQARQRLGPLRKRGGRERLGVKRRVQINLAATKAMARANVRALRNNAAQLLAGWHNVGPARMIENVAYAREVDKHLEERGIPADIRADILVDADQRLTAEQVQVPAQLTVGTIQKSLRSAGLRHPGGPMTREMLGDIVKNIPANLAQEFQDDPIGTTAWWLTFTYVAARAKGAIAKTKAFRAAKAYSQQKMAEVGISMSRAAFEMGGAPPQPIGAVRQPFGAPRAVATQTYKPTIGVPGAKVPTAIGRFPSVLERATAALRDAPTPVSPGTLPLAKTIPLAPPATPPVTPPSTLPVSTLAAVTTAPAGMGPAETAVMARAREVRKIRQRLKEKPTDAEVQLFTGPALPKFIEEGQEAVARVAASAAETAGAAFEKGYRLRGKEPRLYERFRQLQAAGEVRRDQAKAFVTELVGPLSQADDELLHRHGEDPQKYAIPKHLERPARILRRVYDAAGRELKRRNLVGLWPASAIRPREAEIAALREQKETPARLERIGELEGEIETLESLRYVRRLVERPDMQRQVEGKLTRLIDALPRRIIGRKFISMDDLEATGVKFERSAGVALAEYLAYVGDKVATHDFNEWLKAEHSPTLLQPAKQAPGDWVTLKGIEQFKGWALHPMMAEAIRDFAESAGASGRTGTAYDRLNSMYKQIKFYNVFIMTLNNVQQQMAATGLTGLLFVPAAFKHVYQRDSFYRSCQRLGAFPKPSDLPWPKYMDEVRLSLDLLRSKQPAVLKVLRKAANVKDLDDFWRSLLPTDKNVVLRMQRNLTWWLDRVLRVATIKALVRSGKPLDEAVVKARNFHADYDIMRAGVSKWARRVFLTSAYQTAMWYRLFPDIAKGLLTGRGKPGPKGEPPSFLRMGRGEAAGTLANLMFMLLVGGGLLALKGYAFVEGYRFVRRQVGKKGKEEEAVILMPGPFAEPFKLTGRLVQGFRSRGRISDAVSRALYNKLAALPHLVASWRRNRDWKGRIIWIDGAPQDENIKRLIHFGLQELYPLVEQVEAWGEKDQDTVNNVLRIFSIMRYQRKPAAEWYEQKLRTRLGQLRGWARRESERNPALAEHYYQKAGRVYAEYVERINKFTTKQDRKIRAMKSVDGIERLAVQFGLLDAPASPSDPTLSDVQMGRRLWEFLTPRPIKLKGESDSDLEDRRQAYRSKQDFLRSYFENQRPQLSDVERLLKAEAQRRGYKATMYQRTPRGKMKRAARGGFVRTAYGSRLLRLRRAWPQSPQAREENPLKALLK